ncbi:MAG TPA: tetratricopeptide repeat protein [Chloroflexota bacterium]
MKASKTALIGQASQSSRSLSADTTRAAVRIHLLGGFRVVVGTRQLPDEAWKLRKAATLIKLLALAPGHRLHREQVLDVLWPDLDLKAAGNNLHYALHVARRIIASGMERTSSVSPEPAAVLRLQDDLLSLGSDGEVWVDTDAFETAATLARRTRSLTDYRTALDLYTGDLLTEDRYDDALAGRSEAFKSLYLSLLVDEANVLLERGNPTAATDVLLQAVRAEPALEEAHVALMRVYARSGHRQQALRQYEQLEQALRRELDAEPDEEAQTIYRQIMEGNVPGEEPRAIDVPDMLQHHNLPVSLTNFIGRQRETDDLKRCLTQARLVTILGPGGVGKTRLALHAAEDLVDAYRDGIWLVELAAVADPDLVPHVVARALKVQEQPGAVIQSALIETLRAKHVLLLLDNCEHLVNACAEVAETLLISCPELTILATSREVIGIGGEALVRLPPLSLPDPVNVSGGEVPSSDALRLLVDRIRYRDPSFALSERNAEAAVAICNEVDGIPLAIELAAARVGPLSVEQIAGRLSHSLGLLAAGGQSRGTRQPRQQTMKGALDWSYRLLMSEEQELFRNLSVFVGGWTLEGAEAIGSSGEPKGHDVLDVLSRLVDKSLVVAEPGQDGQIRYRLLEPVRQYAAELLREGDGGRLAESAVRRRHAELYLSLSEEAASQFHGPHQKMWLDRLEAEHDNTRAALTWSLTGVAGPEAPVHGAAAGSMGLKLAANLWMFWYIRGYLQEGEEWLNRLLETNPEAAPSERAKALTGLGGLLYAQRQFDAARTPYQEALRLNRALNNQQAVATTLGNLANLARATEDFEEALRLQEESLEIRQALGDTEGVATSLRNLAAIAHMQGDMENARRFCEEGLAMHRQLHDVGGEAVALNNLGEVWAGLHDWKRAEELFEEGLALARGLGSRELIVACLDNLGYTAFETGRYQRAASLHAAAHELRTRMGTSLYSTDLPRWESRLDALRKVLQEQYDRIWAQGREFSLDEAIEFALQATIAGTDTVPSAGGRGDSPVLPLTAREQEIALLVADGRTNREIARTLSLAARTVDTHVSNILKKLDLRSRAQIATWAMTNLSRGQNLVDGATADNSITVIEHG